MKKLMMVAAVALTAFCSHGAMVYWSFSDSAVNNASKGWTYFDEAQNLTGMTAYLLQASDWDSTDVAGSLEKNLASSGFASKETWDTTKGQGIFQTGKLQATGLDLTPDTKGSFMVVIADGDKYFAAPQIDNVDILADGSLVTTYQAAAVSLSNASSLKPSDMKPMSDVPEPTSGLLLLLGMAGLALRRKQA